MHNSQIPVYQKQKGTSKISDLISLKWKVFKQDLYKGIEKPHRHDYFSILFFMQGETIQFVDFKEFKLTQPTILLMHPDQVHVEVETKHAQVLLITFKENLLLSNKESFSWKEIFRHTMVPMLGPAQQEFLPYLHLLEQEYKDQHASEKIIAFLLSAILEKIRLLADKAENLEGSSTHRIAESFKQLVETHALNEVEVSFYAKKLFISAGHLNDTIKKLTGRNAKSFINERRVLEAKRLLFWTENSIQQVAWKTGFKDPAYFTRFFKKHTGVLPGTFQKQTQQDLE